MADTSNLTEDQKTLYNLYSHRYDPALAAHMAALYGVTVKEPIPESSPIEFTIFDPERYFFTRFTGQSVDPGAPTAAFMQNVVNILKGEV